MTKSEFRVLTGRDLIKILQKHLDKKVYVASDEELNEVFTKFCISEYEKDSIVLAGLTGEEI